MDRYEKLVFNLRDHQMGGRRQECEDAAEAIETLAMECDRLRSELDLVTRQFKYAQKVVANLNEQIAALRKQEPACVIDVDRHGNGVLVAGSLDRGIHKLYAAPVQPAAVTAVPEPVEQPPIGVLRLIAGELVAEFVPFVKTHANLFSGEAIYARNVPAPVAQKVQDYKCIDDGGACGLGGYCEKCPHTKHERIASAQAQEGTP